MSTQAFSFMGLLKAIPAGFSGNLDDALDLGFQVRYPASDFGSPSLQATMGSPFEVAVGVMEKISLFAVKVHSGGPIFVLITTAAGVDQIIPVSESLILFNPTPGSEIVSVKLVGTAEVEYTVAGTGITQTAPPPPPPAPPAFDAAYSCDPAVAVLDAVYISSPGNVSRANASAVGTSPVIGFVVSKAAPNLCVVRRGSDLAGFSLVGATDYYLSTSPGQITTVPPNVPGQVFQRVGFAKDSSILEIEVDQDIILLT